MLQQGQQFFIFQNIWESFPFFFSSPNETDNSFSTDIIVFIKN